MSQDESDEAFPATVYVVGVGPGATDLLTLRAVRILERSDLVLHAGPTPTT